LGGGPGSATPAPSPAISLPMGTSSARRGPSTAAWRLAKGAATRYMAPEGTAPLEAREVVRRYVAALEETSAATGQDLLAAFRLTRKVAQSLGEFGEMAAASGIAATLKDSGLQHLAHEPPELAVSGLAAAWVEADAGLEGAVARSALAASLLKTGAMSAPPSSPLDSAALVKSFLAQALCQRLALDLGESLETAAPGWLRFQQGMARLRNEIAAFAEAIPEGSPEPGQWQGLAGWSWITQVLKAFLTHFQGS